MHDLENGEIVVQDLAIDNQGQPQAESGEALLLPRMLLGLLLVGGDELLSRLKELQAELEAGTELAASEVVAGDLSERELLSYMAIGTLVRGQRRLLGGLQRGAQSSVATAGRVLRLFDQLTDNPLGRPVRRPVEKLLWNLVQEGERVVREGRREVHNARLLATRSLEDIISDAIDAISTNPELTVLIRRIVAQQSVGLADTIVDNTRQVTTTADGVAEGVVRRIFLRKPRRELPPSPLAGQPLDMYTPRPESEGAEDNDG